MQKRKKYKSNSQSNETSSSTSSESDKKTLQNDSTISEYEEQRQRRIAENQARLKALGLPQMLSSFKTLPQIHNKKKGKQKVEDDGDDEYVPHNEEEREYDTENASGSRKRKVKNKSMKTKSRVTGKHGANLDNVDEDDDALMQAIALSLQDSAEASVRSNKSKGNTNKVEKKGIIQIQEDKGRKKNNKSFTSRLQMTEDELIVHFFQLDESGKGTVSKRDLERAAITHDFEWTDKELVDMIHYFDSNGDGKLSLDDFRKIIVRCNMIKASESS